MQDCIYSILFEQKLLANLLTIAYSIYYSIILLYQGNKKISYEGPAGSAEEALKLAVQGIFKDDGDNNGNQ